MEKFFLVQVKRTNGVMEKGVVIKDTIDAAKQSYYAYLGAYGYGHDLNTDYVMVAILDINGIEMYCEKDNRMPSPEPKPEQA